MRRRDLYDRICEYRARQLPFMNIDPERERLEGKAAMDALYDWLVGVNHIHTSQGIVYASAIYDIREENARLRAELQAARKDTERLDWLEKRRAFEVYPVLQSECTGYVQVIAVNNRSEVEGKTLRAAIDAALAGKGD